MRFNKRIVDLEPRFPGILADSQVPFSGCAVAVLIVPQSSFHAKDGIREQSDHRSNFAEVFRIDPLVIAIANFFHHFLVNQALQSPVLDLFLLQILCTHHSAVAFKYFFVFISPFHAKAPTQIQPSTRRLADKLMQFYYSERQVHRQHNFCPYILNKRMK